MQWLAIAVSEVGQMVSPQSSRAVVGIRGYGVHKRTLVQQDVTSISDSAPVDSVQVLRASRTRFRAKSFVNRLSSDLLFSFCNAGPLQCDHHSS